VVAQQRAVAAREHRRQRTRIRRLERTEVVDAAVHAPEPALLRAVAHRVVAQAGLDELADRHHAMPPAGDGQDGAVSRHSPDNSPRGTRRPARTGEIRAGAG
jgi:hypothetical protein